MAKANIRKAVIPVAGLGTRFLPVTKAIPKEMIPIIDTPMIQYIVEEAVRSGIREIILVTARHKEAIENYFDYNYEMEDTLEKRGNQELASLSRKIGDLCNIIAIRQKIPMGLGHAVAVAQPLIGDEPFAILLGDDLIDSKVPCTAQLCEQFNQHQKSIVGVMKVPVSETRKYGMVGGKTLGPKLTQVERVVEKPDPSSAPSQLAIPGRYVLTAKIFDCLKRVKPGKNGEIQLTDGLELLAKEDGLLAYEFEGTRFDTGDRLGYLDATLEFALRRPDLKKEVIELMKKHLGKNS